MKKSIFFLLIFISKVVFSQILAPSQPTFTQPRVQFDYWMYSTHGGTGLTNQYPVNITSRAQMDALFNSANSNTVLIQSGRVNNASILDWTSTATLSSMGITIPNSGNYFALKIQGTFIPTESGNYNFSVEGDDAIDFAIDGNYVTSRYTSLAVQPLGSTTGTIFLSEGKSYSFIIRMQNGMGGSGIRMYWRSPRQNGTIQSGYTTNWAQNVEEITSTPNMDGSSAARAAPSALYIKNRTLTNTDGVYWINLPNVGPTQIFCLMNSQVDGGGWMMMMKATTGNTFEYDSSHWTSISTLNPSQTNRNNGDAKFDTMNYFAAKDLLALWPDITTAGGSLALTNYGCWSWLQNNFNNGVRITPINFFNSVNRLFLQDTTNFSGRGNQFSTQADVRFYGFNYNNSAFAVSNLVSKTRWGFGWNENGGGLFPNGNEQSPDVAGGIGLSYGTSVRYSAGDYIGCCQINSGINRQARVEIYVR